MSASFTGVIPPMLTPLTAEEEIDRPAVKRLVDYVIEGGVNGVFILGTNGEGPALPPSACQALAEATVEAAAGRVPVIAGVLEPSTSRVVERVRQLSGRGLDGIVATTPFYFGNFNDVELLDHFRRIAESSTLPVLAYSIPQNTRVPMGADLILRLAEVPNIAGIKDSSGDWTQFQAVLQGRRDSSFAVLQGMQSLSTVSLIAGADGLVPGHANIVPSLLARLVAAVRKGDYSSAFALQGQLDRMAALRGRPFVHSYKLLGQALGLMQDHVVAPLPRFSETEARRFLEAAVQAGIPLKRKVGE